MTDSKDKIPFETAIGELENIVEELEKGNLTLDEALKAFQKGIELSRICSGQLEEAETKIDLLLKEKDDNISLKVLDLDEFYGEK